MGTRGFERLREHHELTLLGRADVISLHVPSTPKTRHLLSR
jgi:phosphoglycerate dehydrogenase-like enzyme